MDSSDNTRYEWNDETAERYARKYGECATNRIPIENILFQSNSTIVDIGCGTGATLRRAAVSKDEIIAWSKSQLAAYKYPHLVEFRDELPKTNVGKILRRALRDESVS